MILTHVHFKSSVLRMHREMDVLLPDRLGDKPRYPDGRIPVLYLLHGWSGSHSDWQRMTGIERYAGAKGMAVVMPGTDLSFYTDMKYGHDFYTFMSVELPALVNEFFPALSTRREDTFVGGLSMGGFGACKLGILQPDRFAAVVSLSGGFDVVGGLYPKEGEGIPLDMWSFGTREEATGSVDDLPFQLEKQIALGTALPRFFVSCGQQDFTYEGNVALQKTFGDRIDLTWHEEPGGHTWDYWDRNIARAIDWLPLCPMAKEG